jgi:hypothetical protein
LRHENQKFYDDFCFSLIGFDSAAAGHSTDSLDGSADGAKDPQPTQRKKINQKNGRLAQIKFTFTYERTLHQPEYQPTSSGVPNLQELHYRRQSTQSIGRTDTVSRQYRNQQPWKENASETPRPMAENQRCQILWTIPISHKM